MNTMEGLTKQQLILLALLVSFVTSMATGIVSVSLMDQAPKSVTQTINRVVERTVEKVMPASVNSAAGVTKETIVVRSDDMVVAAVEQNKVKIVRIMKVRDEYGAAKEKFGGLAIAVNNGGLLVADISILAKEVDAFGSIIPESYKAITADGKFLQVVPVGVNEANSLVFLRAQTAEGKIDTTAAWSSVSLGDSNGLKLGQTVIAIGGDDTNVISTGIISSLIGPSGKTLKSTDYSIIKTDIQFKDAVSGTILLNLSGEVVGMLAGSSSGNGAFLASNVISASVAEIGTANASSTSL
jgi:S1-C subfamily serine protease